MTDLEKALNEAKKAPLFDQKDAYEHFAELAMNHITELDEIIQNQKAVMATLQGENNVLKITNSELIRIYSVKFVTETHGESVEKMEPKEIRPCTKTCGNYTGDINKCYRSGIGGYCGNFILKEPAPQPEQQERTSCDGCDYIDKDDETRCPRCGSNYSLWIHDTNKKVEPGKEEWRELWEKVKTTTDELNTTVTADMKTLRVVKKLVEKYQLHHRPHGLRCHCCIPGRRAFDTESEEKVSL